MFEGPTPTSQQNLWTYILPLKALNHQGLLHAMLALASLHIARLQRASATPSYKHYGRSTFGTRMIGLKLTAASLRIETLGQIAGESKTKTHNFYLRDKSTTSFL